LLLWRTDHRRGNVQLRGETTRRGRSGSHSDSALDGGGSPEADPGPSRARDPAATACGAGALSGAATRRASHRRRREPSRPQSPACPRALERFSTPNLLIRGLLRRQRRSAAVALLDAVMKGRLRLVTSEYLLAEVDRTLREPEVRALRSLSDAQIDAFVTVLQDLAIVVAGRYDVALGRSYPSSRCRTRSRPGHSAH